MTLYVLSFIGLVVLTLALGVCCLIYVTRDARREADTPATPLPAKPVRRYTRGDCPHCGRPDTVLRADGEPHCQYHDCPVLAERLDQARAEGWPPTGPQAPRRTEVA